MNFKVNLIETKINYKCLQLQNTHLRITSSANYEEESQPNFNLKNELIMKYLYIYIQIMIDIKAYFI